MAVKHNEPNAGTSIVHKGTKGGTTGCGISTTTNPSHWTNTTSSITCDKNGCKN